MQRFASLGLALLALATTGGCVAVKDVKVNSGERYPVVMNGEIYLVDTENATACKVAASNAVCAPATHNCQGHDHD